MISLDPKDERVIEQARWSLVAVVEPALVRRYARPGAGTTVLRLTSLQVPMAFPLVLLQA